VAAKIQLFLIAFTKIFTFSSFRLKRNEMKRNGDLSEAKAFTKVKKSQTISN